ncbi:PQQ-binding-like beta-propeller repeat protein [Sphingobacterium bovisgrunnientis]|uniref:PQQ-binding-like beta-propeller repeat protein n=1 Tax=Sphingobacterium bovisgrunnientis TaxID=1874697 RepID=UPI00135BE787|nr:PQQ-binding-like beta-propeller repeat protein [Sphingobacterium bovisgrunnientis]
MRNTIIVTVLLFIGVIAASIYYFRDINKEQHNSLKPLKYLPESTFLIASIKNDEITDNIFKDFDLFDALLGETEMQLIKKYKNQILRHEALYEFIENQDVYISFHPEADSLNLLFTVPTSHTIEESDLTALMQAYSQSFKITTSDTLGQKITALSFGNPDSTLYTTYYQQVIFASYSKNTLISVLDKSKPKLSENQIDYFISNNSKNTPLTIYFPHQQYSNIIKHFQQREKGIFSDQFVGLEGQSAWNINFKQDALMLTGESEVEKSAKNYIALFRNQTKKTQRLYNYFPANTSVFMEYSVSNYSKFKADLKEYFEARDETEKLKSTLQSLADSSSSLSKLPSTLNNSFALVEQTNQTHIAYAGINDTSAWKEIANRILEDAGDDIYRFRNGNILYALYGEPFKNMSRPYVSRVDDVLVISNSSNELRNYLNDFRRKDLLTGTLGFKNFEKLQGNDANVTLFVHNKNAFSKILNSLPRHYQASFRDKENYGFQDFYSWSVQLSGNNGNFSSQIYALYKSKNALGSTPDWTYQLEDRAITAPHVFEQSDTSQMILIQELDHTLHAIHPSGNKLWSTVISGRIVGEMQQMDDRSIVFVTDRNRLYRIDTSGKTLKGFSAGITEEPIAEPLISKWNDKNIFLITSKNSIYAFDLEGNRLSDWKDENFDGKILGAVQQAGTNYVVGTSYGRVYFLNNDGSLQKEIDIPGNVEFKTQIGVVDIGNNLYEILAFDDNSTLYRINSDKILSEIKIEQHVDKYFGAFKNISGSSAQEFTLIARNKLSAYETNSYKPMFEFHFTKDIEDKPQFFKIPTSNEYQIGVASKATNLLYLFGITGTLMNGFPVEGQPLFYYGKINYNSDTYLLCMRRDKKLYAFKHQK